MTTADPDRAQFPIRISKSQDADTVIASASEAIHRATNEEPWIASSQALPCANASRLSQAMTRRGPVKTTLVCINTTKDAGDVDQTSSPRWLRHQAYMRGRNAPTFRRSQPYMTLPSG